MQWVVRGTHPIAGVCVWVVWGTHPVAGVCVWVVGGTHPAAAVCVWVVVVKQVARVRNLKGLEGARPGANPKKAGGPASPDQDRTRTTQAKKSDVDQQNFDLNMNFCGLSWHCHASSSLVWVYNHRGRVDLLPGVFPRHPRAEMRHSRMARSYRAASQGFEIPKSFLSKSLSRMP